MRTASLGEQELGRNFILPRGFPESFKFISFAQLETFLASVFSPAPLFPVLQATDIIVRPLRVPPSRRGSLHLFFNLFLKVFIFRERGRGGERGKHQWVVAYPAPPTRDLACNSGKCSDRE